MKRISHEQILMLHATLVQQTGGSDGVRDYNLLDSALATPFQSFGGEELYPTIEEKAARLGYGLIKNHCMLDGNKRIGIHAMLVLLGLNGIELNYTQTELYEMVFDVAAGNIGYEVLLGWICKHESKNNRYKNILRPILVVPAISREDGIVFMRPDKKILVKNNIEVIWKLLEKCDGHKSVEEICSNEIEEKMIYQLIDYRILSDSCKQYNHFHEVSCNLQSYPSVISYDMICEKRKLRKSSSKKGISYTVEEDRDSEIYKLQCMRRSCRSFRKDSQISVKELGEICDAAYSRKRHATPSGGGLYPLHIYCIVQYEQKELEKGFYEYDSVENKLILYKTEIDNDLLAYCYNDENNAFNSPIQLIICAEFDIQGEKYSNLGYRLGLIEAGQAAQNIVLYCAEKGFSTCELGGILEKRLSKEMELEDKVSPILAIAVGEKSEKVLDDYPGMLNELQKRYVGEDKIVKAVGIHNLGDEASVFGAWARFGNSTKNVAGATGKSMHSALSKAIIEGYERYRSSIERVDYTGGVRKNARFISLNQIAPVEVKLREKTGMPLYDEYTTAIDWTLDMTGTVYIPSDYVFYGNKKDKKVMFGNSSGIAAYTNYDMAKKKAVAELIERDAIMRCWYSKSSPFHVNNESIPEHILKKIQEWHLHGRNVHVLSMKSYVIPTFLCVIESSTYPFFVSGAATAVNGIQEAIEKSFQEAEYNLLLAIKYPCKECPSKTDVHTPMDHGQYYHFEKNAKKLSWLWENKERIAVTETEEIDFEELYKKLEIYFVDLTDHTDNYIKVVRAVSVKLIPIAFGYERDYPLHPEVKKIAVGINDEPHFFA